MRNKRMFFFTLYGVVLLALVGCTTQEEPGYEIVASWTVGAGPQDSLREPMGIGVSPDGYVYVSDARAGRLIKYSADGRFVLAWGDAETKPGTLSRPFDVAVGEDGTVYVVDFDLDRVVAFDPNGQFITAWGSPGDAADC